MSAIVFAGPTLSAEEIRQHLDAECRPPAGQGDVYRAALARPRRIGIIDGYFDGVPSVWHKEILWAIDQGIEVWGSASMGALRAAELAPFGMKGVGRIYQDYRDGRIEDDDEVAVLHAPAELGFRPLSEPMVSVRATLEKAAAAGLLPDDLSATLLALAKSMHYRERTWDGLLHSAAVRGTAEAPLAAFGDWLARGRVDQKREDALAMLRGMAEDAPPDPAPAFAFAFEWTNVWHGLTRRIDGEGRDRDAALVLDELRLDEDRYRRLSRDAALRHLAIAEARRRGAEPDRSALLDQMSRHRGRHRLTRRQDLVAWLEENRIDERGYEALLAECCLAETGGSLDPAVLGRHILAELKWTGAFAPLHRRALEKERALSGEGSATPPRGVDQLMLLVWHFQERNDRAIPDDLDGYARSLGLASRQELYRVLQREYLYLVLGKNGFAGDDA